MSERGVGSEAGVYIIMIRKIKTKTRGERGGEGRERREMK